MLTVTAPGGGGGGGGGGGEEGGGAGSPGGTTGTTSSAGGGSGPGPGPGSGVLSYQASLAGAALSVSRTGTVAVTVKCLGQSGCTGSVTLRTLKAVSARAAASSRKRILVLGSGSFSISGGTVKKVTIRLTAQARRLLARLHLLAGARDDAGPGLPGHPAHELRDRDATAGQGQAPLAQAADSGPMSGAGHVSAPEPWE